MLNGGCDATVVVTERSLKLAYVMSLVCAWLFRVELVPVSRGMAL
jgi:hypothetical protein